MADSSIAITGGNVDTRTASNGDAYGRWYDVHMPTRISPDVVTTVAREYSEGTTTTELMLRYGISRQSVINCLYRTGTESREPHKVITLADRDAVVALYESGMTQAAIGEQLNIRRQTVLQILRSRKVLARRDPRGEDSRHWKGGRYVTSDGYYSVWIDRDDPYYCMAIGEGRVREHRLVMARKLGRPLERHETVHHINGDRLDNHPENLQLRSGHHGNGVAYQCNACGSVDIATIQLHDLPSVVQSGGTSNG